MLQSKRILSSKHALIQGIYFLLRICHNLEFRIENFNFLPFFIKLKSSRLVVLVKNLESEDLNYPKGSAVCERVKPAFRTIAGQVTVGLAMLQELTRSSQANKRQPGGDVGTLIQAELDTPAL